MLHVVAVKGFLARKGIDDFKISLERGCRWCRRRAFQLRKSAQNDYNEEAAQKDPIHWS